MLAQTIFGEWPYKIPDSYNIQNQEIIKVPRITIITPSYNQGNYIEETILSIIHQNYPNIQFIIIDGGSTDKTIEIIKKYEKYLDYWVSEKDKGQSDAINKGIKIANGDIINWLCSDDILLPGALWAIAKEFTNNNYVTVVSGLSRQFAGNEDLGLSSTTLFREFSEQIYTAHICQPSTWFKKEVFDKITPLNINLHYTMDSEMWLQYLIQYNTDSVIYIPKVICGYRYHNDSKTVSQDYLFGTDKTGLIYAILNIMQGPSFIKNLYKPHSKSNIHKIVKINDSISDKTKKNIVTYITLKSITYSKVKKDYFAFIKCSIYYLVMQRGLRFNDYLNLLKYHIAPKFFKK
jgi:glycosyltransferase involved in cell wall biosynthesis